ncbi:MAG: hypothetical protein HY687_05840 [Chloroflexi bacterium]|nr:hypothetical protein [Chloroflexota bacterium]
MKWPRSLRWHIEGQGNLFQRIARWVAARSDVQVEFLPEVKIEQQQARLKVWGRVRVTLEPGATLLRAEVNLRGFRHTHYREREIDEKGAPYAPEWRDSREVILDKAQVLHRGQMLALLRTYEFDFSLEVSLTQEMPPTQVGKYDNVWYNLIASAATVKSYMSATMPVKVG